MKYIKDSGIYAIYNNVSDKIYVGSAKCISRRWYEHVKNLRNNTHKNNHLQSSWNCHKELSFDFYVLEFVNFDKIIKREQFWLDQIVKSYEVYNLNLNVAGFHGKKHSQKTKDKISKTKKEQNLKTVHNEETRIKISEAVKGKKRQPLSDEHKNKISVSSKRIKMSDECKAKLKQILSRDFCIKSPDGTIYYGKNVREFCRLHDLDSRALSAVLNGKRRHHKQWTLPNKNVDFDFSKKHKDFDLIDPNGIRHQGSNLSNFCRLHNINYGCIMRVICGERNHHKNWKKYSIQN